MAESGGHDGRDAVLFIVYVLLFLVAAWFISGGPKHVNLKSVFVAPNSPFGTSTPFPIPTVSFTAPGVDTTGDTNGGTGAWTDTSQNFSGYGGSRQTVNDPDRHLFGLDTLPTSPFAGQVRLSLGGKAFGTDASGEYVIIQYSSSGKSRLSLNGWHLQSAITKRTAYFYSGVPVYFPRDPGTPGPIELSPGDTAIVTTGHSPIGYSFKENMCTGYLSQFQRFTPDLAQSCPSAIDEARAAGLGGSPQSADCLSFVRTLGQCRTAINPPRNLNDSCTTFVANHFTYGTCIDQHMHDSGFILPTWRIFLNSDEALWRSDREVLTLLDQDGKLVDSILF